MRTPLFFLLILLFSINVVQAQHWITNFDKAKQLAKTEHKTILLVFQGSDWCAPCIKLEKEILSTSTFTEYANTHFIMLQADFPKRKKNQLSQEQQTHNNSLAERYNKNGFFPYVVVLDENGAVLGATGYKKTTPEAYIELIESFK